MSKPVLSVIDCLRSSISNPYFEGLVDSELLRRFVGSGSPDAFACLMQRHGPMVLGLARRIVRDHQLAEDVFQATFLTLGRKAGAIRGRASLAAWLHSVAFRLAVRAKNQRRRSEVAHACVARAAQADPLDELTAREFLTILDEELSALPEKYRLPLILCHLEGQTREEAGKRLGLSIPSVKARLERGRERLRFRLIKRGLGLCAVTTASLQFGQSALAVPHALVQSTLSAALYREGASAAAVALANGAIKMMFLAKVQTVCLAVVLLGVGGWGAAWWVRAGSAIHQDQAASAPESTVAAAEPNGPAKEKRVDLYGDALPEGAVMRLGTVQLRAAGEQLALSPDGKTLVGLKGGGYLSYWDAETGRVKQKRVMPFVSKGGAEFGGPICILSPNGRFMAYANRRGALEVWDVAAMKLLHKLADKEALNVWVSPVFSQDSQRLAAGWLGDSNSGTITVKIGVWDVATGTQKLSQDVHGGHGGGIASFAPDGKKLYVGFNPSSTIEGAYLFDLAAGKQLWRAKDFYYASPVAITADMVISINEILDIGSGKKTKTNNLLPRFDQFGTILCSRDGQTLLYSDADGVHVWDLATAKEVRTLAGAGDNMLLAPDGKTLFTINGTLQRWDLSTGKPLYSDNFEKGHANVVTALIFSRDGKHLASGARDGSVRYWDVTTGLPIHVWRGNQAQFPRRTEEVNALDMSRDGRWIISGGTAGRLRVWDATSGKETVAIALPKPVQSGRLVHHLRIDPNGKRAVAFLSWALPLGPPILGKNGIESVPANDWLTSWDLETGKLLTKAPVQGISDADSTYLSRDGIMLAMRNKILWAGTGTEAASLDGAANGIMGRPCVISPDGSLLAGVIIEQRKDGLHIPQIVRISETATGRTVINLHTRSWPAQVNFDATSRYLAVNDAKGIHVWDVVTSKVVKTLNMPAGPLVGSVNGRATASSLAFTPDGRRLATGHPDGTILLWNIDLPIAKQVHPAADEIEPLWNDLKDADAAKAWRAVSRLTDSPDEVVPYLQKRLTPFRLAPENITRPLLTDLDNTSFAKREAAQKRLRGLGIAAEPALRARLKSNPSLESQRRVEAILKTIAEAPQPLTPESLRGIRAVAVLARINSPAARSILETLAKGVESARLTCAANAALGR